MLWGTPCVFFVFQYFSFLPPSNRICNLIFSSRTLSVGVVSVVKHDFLHLDVQSRVLDAQCRFSYSSQLLFVPPVTVHLLRKSAATFRRWSAKYFLCDDDNVENKYRVHQITLLKTNLMSLNYYFFKFERHAFSRLSTNRVSSVYFFHFSISSHYR